MKFALPNPKRLAIGFGVILVGLALLFITVTTIINSTHPDKKVRDGLVILNKFDPEHSQWELKNLRDYGAPCIKLNDSLYQCHEHYPDRWYITVEGCKRYRADPPTSTCDRKYIRTMRVDLETYRTYLVGAKWHERVNT